MPPIRRIILPHEKHDHRAQAISHTALLAYSCFLFIFLLTFKFLTHQAGAVLGFATNIYEEDILSFTNERREDAELSPLGLNEQLSLAARKKADDMFTDDYWAHIAPDGTTPWQFIEETGYDYYYAGENLARDFNDSSSVVGAWMKSANHRDNILGENYQEMGIAVINGVLKGHETTLVVQLFGGKKEARSAAVSPEAVEKSPGPPAVSKPPSVAPEGWPVRRAGMPVLTAAAVEPGHAGHPRLGEYARLSVILFTFFLLSLFGLDLAVVARTGIVRLSGSTVAHIALLLFLIFVAWWANVGVIL